MRGAGQGLRDVTRIAASDPTMWVQILSANAGSIVPSLHGVREDLDRLINTLEDPTGPGARLDMAELIAEGNAGQARIPGKHGGATDAFTTLVVLVPDRPGELARLLTEIGQIGVNLEDLRLEHTLGQPVGLAHIAVDVRAENLLTRSLTDRGWTVLARNWRYSGGGLRGELDVIARAPDACSSLTVTTALTPRERIAASSPGDAASCSSPSLSIRVAHSCSSTASSSASRGRYRLSRLGRYRNSGLR